jgi:lactoylglutathione lyase
MNHSSKLLVASAIAFLTVTGAQAQPAPSENAGPPAVTALTMMASAVPCSNLDRSVDFYTKGLGMTLGGRLEMGTVTEAPLMFPGGGAYLMLQNPKAAGTPLPPRSMLGRVILAVPDLKALEARLKSAGYHLKGPINEQPKYHVAVGMLEDPDGNAIELVQRTK